MSVSRNKLTQLPKSPGVYFHKNKKGEIIYVGKASVLRNRVRQYFQVSRSRDPKTELLVSEIADTDWQVVDSEAEALFLEAEMIRRYMPRYNILLRDDKSMTYLRINFKDKYPNITFTRWPVDDGADYYGPYLSALALKRALKYLRRAFPYSTHITLPKRACLQHHLGLCPGPETGYLEEKAYKSDLKQIVRVLKGQRTSILKELDQKMRQYAQRQDFEKAGAIRNQIFALKNIGQQIIFGDKEFLDISKDHALADLVGLLGLEKPPYRIEGYDISHMSGTNTVASMVVFVNGASDKSKYRKFKSKIAGNDDFLHMNEALSRRFSEKNKKQWGLPDLLLIDGGKGQLSSVLNALQKKNILLPVIGLAKRHEEVVIANSWPSIKLDQKYVLSLGGTVQSGADFTLVNLPNSTHIVKLLQRIRDESHRFAVSYHSLLKTKGQSASLLDTIPGIGQATKKKLLKKFGSLRSITLASQQELSSVIGDKKAKSLTSYLINNNKNMN